MLRTKSPSFSSSSLRTGLTSSNTQPPSAPKSPAHGSSAKTLPQGLQQAISGQSDFTSARGPRSGGKPPVPAKPAHLSSAPTTTQGLMDGFRPPEVPFKNGNRPVTGTQTFRPPKADIPGTGYDLIAPSQQHVSPSIVQQKLDSWKQNPPGKIAVPVYMAPNTQKLTIAGDGHHSFVAAMKGGHPIDLQLVKMPGAGLPALHNSWQRTTYADFNKGDAWVK